MRPADVSNSQGPGPSVTVAIVAICSAEHVERCLAALNAQVGAPPFEVVVVFDPHIDGMPALRARYPGVRMVANAGQRSPLELAARAVRESASDIVLLTEDHCIPSLHWVARLCAAVQLPGRAAAGGTVLTEPGVSGLDWAFYYVDFYRYGRGATAGPASSLTVCNVAYLRRLLDAIAPLWSSIFHETAINEALRSRFGDLWLITDAPVRMRRRVRFADATRERYAFGRLFGCTRLEFAGRRRRWAYVLLSPALPLLLLGRMAARAARTRPTSREFFRGLPALTVLVVAWSWGEWLGYLTRRRPRSLVVAPEVGASSGTEIRSGDEPESRPSGGRGSRPGGEATRPLPGSRPEETSRDEAEQEADSGEQSQPEQATRSSDRSP